MTNFIEQAPDLLDLARRVNEGGFRGLASNGTEPLDYQVLARPDSTWAKVVDEVEADFAPDYDAVEYDNQALNIMGGYEIAMLLTTFGVDPSKPDILETQPLKGKRILDIGCGPGRITTVLALLGAEIDSFDATEDYVQITAKKLAKASQITEKDLQANLFVSPAESFNYEPNTYDYVSAMFGVWNHVENGFDPNYLKRVASSLKEGGKLAISTYGSNDALIFDLIAQGKLDYQPSILVRRVEGGIQLPDGIIPAKFPYPSEIVKSLNEAGIETRKKVGSLKYAALFPKDPTPENINAYLNLVCDLNPDAVGYLNTYRADPQKLLMASFIYDRKRSEQIEINKYAYVAFSGIKK